MRMIKCILFICNPKIESQLLSLINKVNSIEVLTICRSRIEAVEILNSHHPDLLFISTNYDDVLDVVLKPPFSVAVIPDDSEDRQHYYRNYFFDLLYEPISELQFSSLIGRLINIILSYRVTPPEETAIASEESKYNNVRQNNVPYENHIFIKQNKKSIKVKLDDIIYISSDKNFVNIETISGKTYTQRSTLKNFKEILPNDIFVMVNRHTIINFTKVEEFNKSIVYLNDVSFEVKRSYMSDFKMRLNNKRIIS